MRFFSSPSQTNYQAFSKYFTPAINGSTCRYSPNCLVVVWGRMLVWCSSSLLIKHHNYSNPDIGLFRGKLGHVRQRGIIPDCFLPLLQRSKHRISNLAHLPYLSIRPTDSILTLLMRQPCFVLKQHPEVLAGQSQGVTRIADSIPAPPTFQYHGFCFFSDYYCDRLEYSGSWSC